MLHALHKHQIISTSCYSNLSPMLTLSLGLKKRSHTTRAHTPPVSEASPKKCSTASLPSYSLPQPGWQRLSQPYQHIKPSPLPHSRPCSLILIPTFLNAHYPNNKHIKHAFSIITTCDNEGQMLIKGGKVSKQVR